MANKNTDTANVSEPKKEKFAPIIDHLKSNHCDIYVKSLKSCYESLVLYYLRDEDYVGNDETANQIYEFSRLIKALEECK